MGSGSAVVRSLVFPIRPMPARLALLMAEFRLIVNETIRIALVQDIRSRYRLTKAAYSDLSRAHDIFKQYIPSAFEVATSALKNHRRRLRLGRTTSRPYLRRLLLKAENQSYRLDRSTGRLRIPIRGRDYVFLDLQFSDWHRKFLSDSSWSLGSLTVLPGRVVICVRKRPPKPYEKKGVLALDTNESSVDGILADENEPRMVSAHFREVPIIQRTHFSRRRRIGKKKAHDCRVSRRLLAREGQRERARVQQRLHALSSTLVKVAVDLRVAIALEDLRVPGPSSSSRRLNRRLSSWPRSELHRQIAYKALAAGVPIIKVNPAWTSKTCPACGARRRDRVGQDFVCLVCDWEMDRQHNAGLNILNTALASDEALARAVRFQPGALRKDVVIPLYELRRKDEVGREEPSGDEPSSVLGG